MDNDVKVAKTYRIQGKVESENQWYYKEKGYTDIDKAKHDLVWLRTVWADADPNYRLVCHVGCRGPTGLSSSSMFPLTDEDLPDVEDLRSESYKLRGIHTTVDKYR